MNSRFTRSVTFICALALTLGTTCTSMRPPYTPSAPVGPTSGEAETSYEFATVTADPDGDSVRYEFAWGDGATDSTEFLPDDDTATRFHAWAIDGLYGVRARAWDFHGDSSDWSGELAIRIGDLPEDYPKRVVATIRVGAHPSGIAVLPDGSRLYVADYDSARVFVISTGDWMIIDTVSVGLAPLALAALPDGSCVYVSNDCSASVSVIRTSDNAVIATIPVGGGPWGIAALPDGSRVYVADSGGDHVSVIRTSDNTVIATIRIGLTSQLKDVAASPEGERIYVLDQLNYNNWVIRTSDNAVVGKTDLGGLPNGLFALPNGV